MFLCVETSGLLSPGSRPTFVSLTRFVAFICFRIPETPSQKVKLRRRETPVRPEATTHCRDTTEPLNEGGCQLCSCSSTPLIC